VLTREDRRTIRILWIVIAGFVAGVGLLFYAVASTIGP
jgi:phage shock protein PspC (stress-responsive transcriptional regulator)